MASGVVASPTDEAAGPRRNPRACTRPRFLASRARTPRRSIPDIWGPVTTAVTPVYDKRAEPWTMIGVAAVDLPLCEVRECNVQCLVMQCNVMLCYAMAFRVMSCHV